MTAAEVERIGSEWDGLGVHRTGSEVERESAAWLAARVCCLGVPAAVESYAVEQVTVDACSVAAGGAVIEGVPLFDGGSTPTDGVDGGLGPAGSDAAIGLTTADPNGEYDPRFSGTRAAGRHRALVVVTRGGVPGLALINARHFADPLDRPGLQVASQHGEALEEWARGGVRVRVAVRMRRGPGRAYNVTARIPGADAGLAPLVVLTPRSGWWQCASERTGGLVCWLATMRALVEARPARPCLFLAGSGHELGHLGLQAFCGRHPALARDASAWLHFGANLGAKGARFLVQCATADLQTLALQALGRSGQPLGQAIPPGTSPRGEARNVFEAGGRYVSLVGTPGPWFHHPEDRWPDTAEPDTIAALARAFAALAVELAGAGCRTETQGSA